MTNELKPCPFCGSSTVASQALYHQLYRPRCNGWHIVCWGCDTLFGFDVDYAGTFETEQQAIKAWNAREQ